MIDKMKSNSRCLCCGSEDLVEVLDLKDQPLANSYLKSAQAEEDTYPLKLVYCKSCTHLQLSHTVNPDFLFKDYIYVSGTSSTLRQYFYDFVGITRKYVEGKKVLDIACNDGTQLDFFQDAGYETYGIDPAENLHAISSKRHNVVCDYLDEKNVASFGIKFDVIIAQNVLAHNDYPKQFLEYCKGALSDKGKIFIQTSQSNMVFNNEFDTVYHEHLSFFSVKSFCALAHAAGLKVVDVFRTPVHGVSFVFVLSNSPEDVDSSELFIGKEKVIDLELLEAYSKSCDKVVRDLVECCDSYRELGYKIVGYGAAAKGNTLLNYSKLHLDYIVDDNQLKQGLFTPGMRVPIYHPDELVKESKIVVVPLAWNFFDEIYRKVSSRINTAIFIKYFPKIEIL